MTHNFFTILLILALIATLGALAFGLGTFFRGGEFNRKYGNVAMRWRVMLQSLALILFLIALWFGR
jgi:hypothetical protein